MQKIPVYKKIFGEPQVVAYALVDESDFQFVAGFSQWWLHSDGYAQCKSGTGDQRKTVLMHRLILGLTEREVHCDHINHNRLDNQRSNLRAVSQTENNRNPTPNARSDSSSQYKGVGRYRGGWRAQGWANGKTVWIGKFETEELARQAYDEWKAGNVKINNP